MSHTGEARYYDGTPRRLVYVGGIIRRPGKKRLRGSTILGSDVSTRRALPRSVMVSNPVTGPFCCCTRAYSPKEATLCERLVLSRTLVYLNITGAMVDPGQDLSWRGLVR